MVVSKRGPKRANDGVRASDLSCARRPARSVAAACPRLASGARSVTLSARDVAYPAFRQQGEWLGQNAETAALDW